MELIQFPMIKRKEYNRLIYKDTKHSVITLSIADLVEGKSRRVLKKFFPMDGDVKAHQSEWKDYLNNLKIDVIIPER